MGEITVTFQDMMAFFGIPIDSPLVTWTDDRDWLKSVRDLLCREPPPTAMSGGVLKLKWIHQQFSMAPLKDAQTQYHACSYILDMIDTTLFSDYSTNKVHLRWLSLLEDINAYSVKS